MIRILAILAIGGLLTRSTHAELLASGWIPNAILPQGQIQLLAIPHGVQLNVLLHTRFLDRVIDRIVGKETANWPADHPDATRYLELLNKTRDDVRATSQGKGREALILTFILTADDELIQGFAGSIQKVEDRLVMESADERDAFTPSRAYLYTNILLILEDSLGLSQEQARSLISPSLEKRHE